MSRGARVRGHAHGLPAVLLSIALLGPARVLAAQTAAYEQLQMYSGVLGHVRLNYVDSVDFGGLIQASIRGMLSSLDPHSHYMTRQEFDLRQQWNRGELGSPGITLDHAGRSVVVLAVAPEGPAERAGVQAGDRVLRLNDSAIAGLGARTIEFRLLGEKGSKVGLTLERGSGRVPDTFTVKLKRAVLERRVVSTPRLVGEQTGYLRLSEFTPLAPKAMEEALRKLRSMGARRLILDLRGHPGGDTDAMVAVASAFLPAGTRLFRTQGRKKIGLESVATQHQGDFTQLPLILLTDAGSASAAEILAGSLQDHDRALVLGRRTFGKALLQSSLPLPDGDMVWLTTARVLTPSGRIIQRRYSGVEFGQYLDLAGQSGAGEDTATVFRTGNGREVRGGGGILPDVVRPLAAELPVWFSVAVDSGYDAAVADSVARSLPQRLSRSGWVADSAAWEPTLLPPFLSRVRSRLQVPVELDATLRARLARILAARTILTRWGADAAEEFQLRYDADVHAAVAAFPRLAELLSGRETPR